MAILELIQAHPRTSIIIMAFLVVMFTTVITYFVTDRDLMREIKKKQKWLRSEMKKYKDNSDKMMELNKQMMEQLPEQMKQSFKPMLITLIPLLILFVWLKGAFATTEIASSWIWWYIGSSLVFSIVLRKIFKLE